MLRLKDVKAEYITGKEILTGISLDIEEEDTVAIIGANGMGKSTLLSVINGALPLKSGNIEVCGRIMNKKNIVNIRKDLGMLFQNPQDQLFLSSVKDDIAFGPKNMGMSRNQIKEKTKEILQRLDRIDLIDKKTFAISGGEKRIVALAGVLIMDPKIILMDEPTSFLDPRARKNFIRIIKKIDKTKLIVTHDLDMALDVCKKVIILYNGSIVANGDANKILRDKELLQKYQLELPLSIG